MTSVITQNDGLLSRGSAGRWSSSQQWLNLLLNLNKPNASFFIKSLSSIARVFNLSVLSICAFNRLDLILQLPDLLCNGGDR
jgi:hypothetical protein